MELISPFCSDKRHRRRVFACTWPERPEDGRQVAERLHELSGRLLEIPALAFDIWPAFDVRAPRVTDPGPVRSMTVEDLGRLMERRGRFDPPRLPAPVGPEGYDIAFGGHASFPPTRAAELAVYIRIGRSRPRSLNHAYVEPRLDSAIWSDPETSLRLLDSMIEVFEASWATAFGRIPSDPIPGAPGSICERPWMIWSTEPPPPASWELQNWQRALSGFGPATEVRPHRGGRLSVWP